MKMPHFVFPLAFAISAYPTAAMADSLSSKSNLLTICHVLAGDAHFDGRVVTLRGAPSAFVHGILLSDSSCPELHVFLEVSTPDIDLTLCRSDRLAALYGCPPNPDSGVRFTVTGTFHLAKGKGFGVLKVTSLDAVGSDRS
jgi:hypothetical protein